MALLLQRFPHSVQPVALYTYTGSFKLEFKLPFSVLVFIVTFHLHQELFEP